MSVRKVVRLASTPLSLLILLGLLAGGVYWGYQTVTAKVPGPAPAACVTTPMTELTTASVTVNVYNTGSKRGLAGRVSDTLKQGGFMLGTVDNSTEKVSAIVIVGAAVDNPEVQLVAAWFVDAIVQADQRPDHTVDVLLGDSFDETKGWAATPPTTLEVPSGVVCLPPSETPTPTPEPTPEPTDQPT